MIDNVAKQLLGPRMCITGLLEQKDLGGTRDARAGAAVDRADAVSHRRAQSRYLQDMVARGDVGIRSGRGFYDWRGPRARRRCSAGPTSGCSVCSRISRRMPHE